MSGEEMSDKAMKNRCEYNPILKRPAIDPPLDTDCNRPATVCVGANGKWFLCEQCAALPEFQRLKKTPLRPKRDGK